jgi:hypothetical protein
LKPQLLATAIAVSIIAALGATPIPAIGGNDGIQRLALAASIILWITWAIDRLAQKHHADTRRAVDNVGDLTEAGGLLRAANGNQALTLPTPHGSIHPVPADFDGLPMLVGVDESAALADIIELRRAISDGDGKAAL